MLEISAILLQVFIAFMSLISGLILTYFSFRLNQKNKSSEERKLEIIRAATREIKKYSEQIKPPKENKELADYIIYEIPAIVNEIESGLSILKAESNRIYSKLKYISVVIVSILLSESILLFYFDLSLVLEWVIFLITSLLMVLTIGSVMGKIKQLRRDAERTTKKYQLFTDELDNIKSVYNTRLFTCDQLTEFIRQRNKLGFGISLTNIKEELELYGIKFTDAKIIRAHLNLFYPNPEDQQEILTIFYMDGKAHLDFNELSDTEILSFFGTIEKNFGLLKPHENS